MTQAILPVHPSFLFIASSGKCTKVDVCMFVCVSTDRLTLTTEPLYICRVAGNICAISGVSDSGLYPCPVRHDADRL